MIEQLSARGHHPYLIAQGIDPTALEVFDGLHTYGPPPPDWASVSHRNALIARAYALVHGGARRVWAPSVMPGYDDRHLQDRQPQYIPREDGAYFRSQWEIAVASDPDQVLVVSFNEWLETTNIEPNMEWGDRYLAADGRAGRCVPHVALSRRPEV